MSGPSRRSFLTSMAAAGIAAPWLRSASAQEPTKPKPQKILVLGGTGFLGPHFVRAALANGHTVTLFNRGKTNPGLFAELEQLRGDREQGDLAALQGRTFDAILDTSGYVPAHVDATAQRFAGSAQHYLFVSSISVYSAFGDSAGTIDESAAVGTVADEDVAKVSTIRQSLPFYGPMKARCEAAAEAAMPGRVANVRPGLIVGPGDPSDRFTYWPWRIDQGGEVLAPGPADGLVQFVDVRDLAAWLLHCIEQRIVGVYNATGFRGTVSMGDLLAACKCATEQAVELVWVDEPFLAAEKVGAWMELPLWLPSTGRTRLDVQRALAAGLRCRPVADTVRDTLQWAKSERGDQPFAKTGLRPERERELLAKWRARAAAGR